MFLLNTVTNEKVECFTSEVLKGDLLLIRKHFSFDWKSEISKSDTFKLITLSGNFIHGLISIRPKDDCLKLRLIESADINLGKKKLYDRVAGNLIAYAAKVAIENFEGYMMTISKTAIIEHYCSSYGFVQIGSSQLLISHPHN